MNSRQSIRKKVALAIAASLGVGLLLSFLTFAVREVDQRRQAKTTELFAMADVVAFNASAVIEFRDVTGAKRLLSSFAEHKDVLAVRLIGITSDFHYRYDAAERPLPAQVALGDNPHRERAVYADWSSVTVAVPIRSDDDVVGTVSISASLDAVWRAIIWNLTLSLLALAVAGALGGAGATYLTGGHARAAAGPVPALAHVSGAAPQAAAPDFAAIAGRHGAAVVNISVSGPQKTADDGAPQARGHGVPGLDPNDPLYEFFRRFQGPQGRDDASEQPVRGQGSGFVVSADGCTAPARSSSSSPTGASSRPACWAPIPRPMWPC